jgi:hypothetical protein
MDAQNIKNRRLMETQKSFVLNPETGMNLLSILQSNDTSNLDVAEETIRYIDVEANLPYLLIMFKESSVEVRDTVFIKTIKDQLNKACKVINIEDANYSITYDQMFAEVIKHNVDAEAMQFFLDRFGERVKVAMITWGFSFLDHCDMKLSMKK